MKKILSFVLAVLMVMSGLSFTAFAEYLYDTVNEDGFIYLVRDDGTAEIRDYENKEAEEIEIPETLGGHKIEKLAVYSFSDCLNLKKVTIPKGVTWIADGVFSGCADGLTVRYGGTKEEWIALAAYQTREGKETVAGPLDHYPYYRAGGEATKSFEYTVKFDRGIHHLTVICADGTVLTYGELAWSK